MPTPPRLARRLVARFTARPTRGYMLADLDDRFRSIARTAPLRARAWYWRQAILAVVTPLPYATGVSGDGPLRSTGAELAAAIRSLRRRPAQPTAAVLTLGLGIGVVGAAFSILWGTVLRGLPFDEADRLVHFERADESRDLTSLAVTPHDYLAWREAQRSFVDLGAYVEAVALFDNEGTSPDRYDGVAISAASFGLLGVEPALGRAFSPLDEEAGGPAVILLSHQLWSSRFAADPSIVDRDVVVNGRPTTVLGVMPDRFGFPIAEQFWIPLRIDLTTTRRGSGRLDVFGRLGPGASIATAREEFATITARLSREHPDTNAGITAVLRSFEEEYVGEEFTRAVWRLVACAVLVLIVCCANVANLLLLRGAQRRRDLAVRVSLGATRGRLVRLLLSEAIVLGAVGATIGIVLAVWGVGWFDRAGSQAGVLALPHGSQSLFWWNLRVDAVTLAVVATVTGLATAIAGLAPAVRIVRALPDIRSGRSDAARAGSGRFVGGLVVAQLALACSLLVTAGLVGGSVLNVGRADDVIEASSVLVASVALPSTPSASGGGGYPDHGSRLRFAEELEGKLRAEPAIEAVAAATDAPLDPPARFPVQVENTPVGGDAPEVGVVTVGAGYFEAFGVDPLEGRSFDDRDHAASPLVTVVTETFAERFLNGGRALGARLRVAPLGSAEPWATVVGVVPDLWEDPSDPARQAGLYFPMAQSGIGTPEARLGRFGLGYPLFVIRGRTEEAVAGERARRVLYELDPSLPALRITTMSDLIDRRLGRYRVWAHFYLAFAGAALLLAALGVYGVLAFDVTSRRSEIGVRRALGAPPSSVQRAVLRTSGIRIAVGLALGSWLGLLMSSGIGHVLYGVDPHDLRVYVAVSVVLLNTGLLASWLPARRAARVDPLIAIRAD